MKTKEDCATVKEESCVIVDFGGRAIFIFSMHNRDRWEPKVERKKMDSIDNSHTYGLLRHKNGVGPHWKKPEELRDIMIATCAF